MATKSRISIVDAANQQSTVNPNTDSSVAAVATIAALNAVAEQAWNDGFILGRPTNVSASYKGTPSAVGAISSSAAREIKWLVTMRDITEFLDSPTDSVPNPSFNETFEVTWPTANYAALPEGSEYLPLTDPIAADTVAAMEVTFVSPNGGELEVVSIRKVGRNI